MYHHDYYNQTYQHVTEKMDKPKIENKLDRKAMERALRSFVKYEVEAI